MHIRSLGVRLDTALDRDALVAVFNEKLIPTLRDQHDLAEINLLPSGETTLVAVFVFNHPPATDLDLPAQIVAAGAPIEAGRFIAREHSLIAAA
ncbi:MAG: hypothetical protein SynsKO_05320 [Synoicihabitans sp.]